LGKDLIYRKNQKIMNVTWVVENYSQDSSFKEMAEAVEKQGFSLIDIDGNYSVNRFGTLRRGHNKRCVISNGSISMIKTLQKDLGANCSPIAYSTFERYKCSAYYSHFGPYLFNNKYCLMSLSELVRQRFDVFGHYGKDATIFVRPDEGEKPWQAGLLDLTDLDKFYDDNKCYQHDLVLVSTPKKIAWEGRFVCSKYREIIASSTYKFQELVVSIPSVRKESIKFCEEVLKNMTYFPDSVFCLDICQSSEGEFRLLELTSFSSAGLYSCDKGAIVKRVSEIAIEDFNEKAQS
jgi:hypothetical protein